MAETKLSEYGSLLTLESRSMDREDCASVTRRYGAWLVSLHHSDRTEDATADELYDAAGSLVVAKRLARSMAKAFGYSGAVRWRQISSGRWVLEMTNIHENWRYADDEDEL